MGEPLEIGSPVLQQHPKFIKALPPALRVAVGDRRIIECVPKHPAAAVAFGLNLDKDRIARLGHRAPDSLERVTKDPLGLENAAIVN